MFNTIVIANDGFDHAFPALDLALTLAKESSAGLHTRPGLDARRSSLHAVGVSLHVA
jgi:hypothetical protein